MHNKPQISIAKNPKKCYNIKERIISGRVGIIQYFKLREVLK